jgi:hypothetical protein
VHFFDITQGKEVKKIDVTANNSAAATVILQKNEHLSAIGFASDGCTIGVGTNIGRVIGYNLKDVKGSKSQI